MFSSVNYPEDEGRKKVFSSRHGIVFRKTWILNGKEWNMPCNIDTNCTRRYGCQHSWLPSCANLKPRWWFTHRRTNRKPVAYSLCWCYATIVCRRCKCVCNEKERRCNMYCTYTIFTTVCFMRTWVGWCEIPPLMLKLKPKLRGFGFLFCFTNVGKGNLSRCRTVSWLSARPPWWLSKLLLH